MAPRISVIVPIYQVEAYLEICLDSILAQTFRDIELILVDDGSKDGSGRIADAYAARHPNIQVIHQENAGLGAARNKGLSMASGTYVGFVDSDDWIDPHMYEKLYAAAVEHDADVVVSGHTTVSNGVVLRKTVHPMSGKLLTDRSEIDAVRKCLYGNGTSADQVIAFPTSVCTALYRREMVESNALKFQKIMSEDILFNLSVYQCARRIVFTNGTDYFYRKDGQISVTAAYSEGTVMKYVNILQVLMAKAQCEDAECILRVKRRAIDYCRMYVTNIGNSALRKREKKASIRVFVENKDIRDFWAGYPVECLPLQQRIFHKMLVKGYYGSALLLQEMKTLYRGLRRRKCAA